MSLIVSILRFFDKQHKNWFDLIWLVFWNGVIALNLMLSSCLSIEHSVKTL